MLRKIDERVQARQIEKRESLRGSRFWTRKDQRASGFSSMSIARLPRNIWVLAVCQFLTMSSAPLMVFVGGLLGRHLAPSPKWATLPLTALILGTALSTIPAAMLMKRVGRKRGSYVGYGFALLGSLLAMQAAVSASFGLFLTSALLLGVNLAFAQQFRFAALESLEDPDDFPTALSVMMLGGLVSAFIGPEIGLIGKDLIDSPHGYAGSFLLLTGLIVASMAVFAFFKEPVVVPQADEKPARSTMEIARNPYFAIAILASAVSFGVMSFVMTATPLNMTELCGIDLSSTKRLIQGHIASMFLPSLLGGWLIRRLGIGRVLLGGALCYCGMMAVGLAGQELLHFWGSLIFLGIGWNFLFVGGTALLPKAYRASERFKAQAFNDFAVFGIQAIASLGAGWFLFEFGWPVLIWVCLPAVIAAALAGLWLIRKRE